jgi:phosphoglycerate dehydrogenase-like enzyme
MKILITTSIIVPEITAGQLAAIQNAAGADSEIVVATNADEALAGAPGSDIVFGRVDPDMAALMPDLKWIQATVSGVDAQLFAPLRDNDVIVTCEKGMVGPHLAEHAIGLLLLLTRQLAAALRDGPQSWQKRVQYRRVEIELTGLHLAIIGFGGTGRALAQRAAAFDMAVRAVDRDRIEQTVGAIAAEPLDHLDELLAGADVVALCTPLTGETRHMVDERWFSLMKPGTFLINVTRGELIEPNALLRALDSGRLGGAGLDVQHREPLPADDPLWHYPNVVLTPHTAGASQFRAARNVGRFVENLGRYRRGEPLLGVVDKGLVY